MGLVNVRELLSFPPGDNSSYTNLLGAQFNKTALEAHNYTYYSNGTISNGSLCFLLFEPYTPFLLMNGTFLNSTSCYSAVDPLGPRSKVGIFYVCAFAISIMFTFINLRKHGRLFLPTEKRFRAVGRRWQWYWMLFVAACAIISGISNVDVDRYYLPELPIVLSVFFWFLMLPTTMAIVWESVRHWGSWQERQKIDPNPFMLKQDDRRGTIEFYLPLVFYLFAFLNFFMVVPRSWGALERQRSIDQTSSVAEPMATDVRFKAAAFLLLISWLITLFSLVHSVWHYKLPHKSALQLIGGMFRYTPVKFMLLMPLSLAMVGYEAASAFDFDISPLKLHTQLGYMYGLGWSPILLIIVVQEVWGYILPNEDRELICQRRVRGQEIDSEMGIMKKPHWWSRLNGAPNFNVREQIAKNAREIGGGQPTMKNLERSIEMGNMPVSKRRDSERSDTVRLAASLLFPQSSASSERSDPFTDEPDRVRNRSRERSEGRLQSRSDSTTSGVSVTQPPQKIKSMLDV